MEEMMDFFGHAIFPLEIPHIEKHKYYMSQSANRDVGFELAVSDWVRNFRSEFLRWHAADDINSQKVALALHLAGIKSREPGADLHQAAIQFAQDWRDQNPFLNNAAIGDELLQPACEVDYVSKGDFQGTLVTKLVRLLNGVHIRPSTHLHALLQGRYHFRVFMHTAKLNENQEDLRCICLNNRYFIESSKCGLIEFFEFSTVAKSERIMFFLETADPMELQRFCVDLAFLDRDIFV